MAGGMLKRWIFSRTKVGGEVQKSSIKLPSDGKESLKNATSAGSMGQHSWATGHEAVRRRGEPGSKEKETPRWRACLAEQVRDQEGLEWGIWSELETGHWSHFECCEERYKSVRSKDLSRRQEQTSSWSIHLEGNWDLKDLGDREVDEKLLLVTSEATTCEVTA